jgi:hypothetical protein
VSVSHAVIMCNLQTQAHQSTQRQLPLASALSNTCGVSAFGLLTDIIIRVSGFHDDVTVDRVLLGCCALRYSGCVPVFRMNTLHPSSGFIPMLLSYFTRPQKTRNTLHFCNDLILSPCYRKRRYLTAIKRRSSATTQIYRHIQYW